MIPNTRELEVMRRLCLGNVEESANMPGIGPKTFDGMIAKGWLQHAVCERYGTVGYKLTQEGSEVFDIAEDPRRRRELLTR